jgi:hypothetical protein
MDYRRDLRSKLMDGLLPMLVLYLLTMLVIMPAGLIEGLWGGPGLLVYLVCLLGIAMYSMQRALVTRYSEVTRAWYGMSGGLLAWLVLNLSSNIENQALGGLTPVILWIMATLVTMLLWRPYLPVGARFFLVTCLAAAARLLIIQLLSLLSGWSPALHVFYLGAGFVSAAAFVLVLAWAFVFSEWHIQRMWAALAAALLALSAFSILGGSIF